MEKVHPDWDSLKQAAYTDAALVVCALDPGQQLPFMRVISMVNLSTIKYAHNLRTNEGENFRDRFIDDLIDDRVINYNSKTSTLELDEMGHALIIAHLEDLLN
jgi:hypothetical protein